MGRASTQDRSDRDAKQRDRQKTAASVTPGQVKRLKKASKVK